MMETKIFRYVVSNADFIRLHDQEPSPILWNKKGVFRIIPVAQILNKLECITVEMGSYVFMWAEAIIVPQEFAKLILGKDVNRQCVYTNK